MREETMTGETPKKQTFCPHCGAPMTPYADVRMCSNRGCRYFETSQPKKKDALLTELENRK